MKADADPEMAARDAAALARVLLQDGRADEAHAALEAVDETALSERSLARVLFARLVTLNFGLGRTDAADAVFRQALRRLRDPALTSAFVAQHAYHLAMRGECRRALDLLGPAGPGRSRGPAAAHPVAVAARAIALTQLGRCRQAVALCESVLCESALRESALSGTKPDETAPNKPAPDATVPNATVPNKPVQNQAAHNQMVADHTTPGGRARTAPIPPDARMALELARHSAGLLSGEAARTRVLLAGFLNAETGGPCDATRALLEVCLLQAERLGGALHQATRRARRTLAPRSGAADAATVAAAAETAHLAALRGDLAEAEEALAAARRAAFPATRLPGFWLDLARPWVIALRDGPAAATTAALTTAGRARGAGLHAFELLALHDAVRLAPPGSAPCHPAAARLGVIATVFEGDLAPVAAAHARAAATADAAGLMAASRDLERIGMPLHAAEAAAQAADVLAAAGRDVAARAPSARAWYLSLRCAGARTPALARVREPRLTNREGQVACLAAGGLTSKRIAARLGMSVRTVDNHLRAVYTKLGISGRAELAAIGMRPCQGGEGR
ncbi:helix-turn-helix transcriptional regulator [Thermopolyspora sp. NPDC052614]|uniref:helix-turn-helix transcriptional regulator n=1 Tax=Thermopolyspora sp. NPDC052614 TaxID=3155682 RepID=UPI00342C4C19